MAPTVPPKKKHDFDPRKFLATIGEGRKVVPFPKKQTIFAQGDAADAVFYIQQRRAAQAGTGKTEERKAEEWMRRSCAAHTALSAINSDRCCSGRSGLSASSAAITARGASLDS